MSAVATGGEARFGFAVVNVGAEKALKAELARIEKGARLAFSRPGLVTFKAGGIDERFASASVIARVRGLSLGMAESIEDVLRFAGEKPSVLHVFARDTTEEGPSAEDVACAAEVEAKLAGDARFVRGRPPRNGERVVDVICAATEPMFVGAHLHSPGRWRHAGGRVPVVVPEGAPSRAYRKLEEALAWSGIQPKQGSIAVELGAAPGGAALALARRGVSVVGIDPAELDAGVLAFEGPSGARVTHVAKPGGGLTADDVPRTTKILLMDVNLAPPIALRYFAHLAALAPVADTAILTLKINDDRMLAAIPKQIARLVALGWQDPIATRLPSNRSEICVVARR
jgi:23S rRNA (cytidine2498-2'-O)-methyltransferase